MNERYPFADVGALISLPEKCTAFADIFHLCSVHRRRILQQMITLGQVAALGTGVISAGKNGLTSPCTCSSSPDQSSMAGFV